MVPLACRSQIVVNAYLSSYRLQLYFLFRMDPILNGLTALATSSLKQFIGPFRDQ
jgi:hypothetical protein